MSCETNWRFAAGVSSGRRQSSLTSRTTCSPENAAPTPAAPTPASGIFTAPAFTPFGPRAAAVPGRCGLPAPILFFRHCFTRGASCLRALMLVIVTLPHVGAPLEEDEAASQLTPVNE